VLNTRIVALSSYPKPALHQLNQPINNSNPQRNIPQIISMRFTVAAAAAAALVAGVSANYSNATTIYTTEVVTAYTTYCPAPTSIVHGNQTYTVTEVRVTLQSEECAAVARPRPLVSDDHSRNEDAMTFEMKGTNS